MNNSMKYGIGLAIIMVTGGYFLLSNNDTQPTASVEMSPTQPRNNIEQKHPEQVILPMKNKKNRVDLDAAPKNAEQPVAIYQEAITENVYSESSVNLVVQKDEYVEQQQVPALEKEAVGHFGTVKNPILFHTGNIKLAPIDTDRLPQVVAGIVKRLIRGSGNFYMQTKSSNKFSGKTPTAISFSKDDYDRVRNILADKNRDEHGYAFHFPYDRWATVNDSTDLKNLLLKIRKQAKNIALIIVRGHADANGTEAYNLALSLKRAQYISRLLPEGIDVIMEAVGENDPIADNATAAGRVLNRRGELILVMQNPEKSTL